MGDPYKLYFVTKAPFRRLTRKVIVEAIIENEQQQIFHRFRLRIGKRYITEIYLDEETDLWHEKNKGVTDLSIWVGGTIDYYEPGYSPKSSKRNKSLIRLTNRSRNI